MRRGKEGTSSHAPQDPRPQAHLLCQHHSLERTGAEPGPASACVHAPRLRPSGRRCVHARDYQVGKAAEQIAADGAGALHCSIPLGWDPLPAGQRFHWLRICALQGCTG